MAQKKQISDEALEILEFAADNGVLILGDGSSRGHGYRFDRRNPATKKQVPGIVLSDDEVNPPPMFVDRDDMPEIKTVQFNVLHDRGFIVSVDRDKYVKSRDLKQDYFTWYDRPFMVTDEGREYLEGNRDRLRQLREERAATPVLYAVTKDNRFGSNWSSDKDMRDVPLPGELVEVVRETDKRVYIKPGTPGCWKGSAKEKYVDREDILAMDVTPEAYKRMKAAAESFLTSMDEARSRMKRDMAPILERYANSKKQMAAMLEDEMREALGEVEEPAGPKM